MLSKRYWKKCQTIFEQCDDPVVEPEPKLMQEYSSSKGNNNNNGYNNFEEQPRREQIPEPVEELSSFKRR